MNYGPVIRDGRVLYTSVSALSTADPDQGGCYRKWWIRYVLGIREAQTEDMATGTEVHKQIETYLTTGEDVLGRIANAARRFIPAPGRDLRVETEIGGSEQDRTLHPGLYAVLTAGGIPVVGKIDLIHTRGRAVTKAGDTVEDPPGTVEVLDWKTTKDWKYAKPDEDLMRTIQMPGYAEFAFREMPTLEHARLSHVVMKTSGAAEARKATILVDREAVAKRWMSVDAVGRTIADIAREPDVSRVPANANACGMYRGCPYRNGNPCHLNHTDGLASIFGPRLADLLKGSEEMNLEDQIAGLMASTAAPSAAPVGFTQKFADAVETIRAVRRDDGTSVGFPALTGAAKDAMDAFVGAGGLRPETAGVLAQKSFTTPDEVVALSDALVKAKLGSPKTWATSAPVDADPLAGVIAAAEPVAAAAAPAAEPEKPKRGSPAVKKPVAAAAAPAVALEVKGETLAAAVVKATVEPTPSVPGVELYINAMPNVAFESLDAYVDSLHATLRSVMSKSTFADIRSSEDDRLKFGAWKGALAAFAREKPPAPGRYVIDTRASELHAVVADALRSVATLVVRGL